MITLKDIMQLECMNNYKIIAGPKTLHQPIENIAMLDYEPLEKRYDVFLKNEFVVTSLLFGKDNKELINEAVLALAKRGISAIAIQKLYDFELDNETIEIINQSQTTLIIYQDVYMEEIIGSVKHLLYKDSDETKYENWINELMQHNSTSETAKRITHELIPDQWNDIRCHLVEPLNKNDSFHLALQQLRMSLCHCEIKIYKYKHYYLFIEGQNIDNLPITYNHYAISDTLNHDELCYALKQVTQAMEYAKDNQIDKVFYANMKSDVFSYAVKDNWLIQNYCKKQMNTIQNHDDEYGTNLMETLLCYILCHGDAKQCGNQLYQHPNTIRYRIGKIKDLLNLNDLEEKAAYEYLYILVHLHKL